MSRKVIARWTHPSVIVGALVVLLAACALGSPSPRIDRADAVRAVLAENGSFAGIAERDPELIGQASWYEVSATDAGWRVTVRIGWGDCESGCIHEHRWTYEVAGGAPALAAETGDPMLAASGIAGIATAGPTCPVMREPPDPACDDRPVADAVIVIRDSGGAEVTRVITNAEGRFSVELAPGAYRVEPQPVEGLLGTAAPLDVRVEAGQPMEEITVGYDTGIR